jgi:hypothetical protein
VKIRCQRKSGVSSVSKSGVSSVSGGKSGVSSVFGLSENPVSVQFRELSENPVSVQFRAGKTELTPDFPGGWQYTF